MISFSLMPINEVWLKSKSKKAMYKLLTIEDEIYLLPAGDTHNRFLSQIMCGDKQYLMMKLD